MQCAHNVVSTAGSVNKVEVMLPKRVTGQTQRAAGFMCDKERKLKDQKIQGFSSELIKLLVLVQGFFCIFAPRSINRRADDWLVL